MPMRPTPAPTVRAKGTALPFLKRHCLCCTVKDAASAVLAKTLPLPCVRPLPFVAEALPFPCAFRRHSARRLMPFAVRCCKVITDPTQPPPRTPPAAEPAPAPVLEPALNLPAPAAGGLVRGPQQLSVPGATALGCAARDKVVLTMPPPPPPPPVQPATLSLQPSAGNP